MKEKKSSLINFSVPICLVFLSITGFFLIKNTVYACQCANTLPCVAYSQARQVFIGKLQKIVKDETSHVPTVDAHFTVERMFKGGVDTEVIVKFETVCREEPFKIGQTYFVYDWSGAPDNRCNRTDLLTKSKQDLDYAEITSAKNPKYLIKGRLDGLSDEELTEVEVVIEDGDESHKVILGKYGWFEFSTQKQKSFKVKIMIPLQANVHVNKIKTSSLTTQADDVRICQIANQTSIEYNLDFKPNECDFREISIRRDN